MKLRIYFYTVLILPMILAGCEKIEIGESFDTTVGVKFRVDSNLSFLIDSIRDYRCPKDLICIWGGDVDIHIRFNKTFNHVDTVIYLNNPDRNPIKIGGYSFKVNEVNPVPESNKITPQKDFKINITVLKD